MENIKFEHHHVRLNDIAYHFVTTGGGPAVLFCHGFPDLWRGWRNQMAAIAAQGYLAIAPDMRGFGETEAPENPLDYTAIDLVGDMIALLDHLSIDKVAIIGHDWGATIAWAAALLRPDRFVAVAAMSVPYTPRGPASLPAILANSAPPDLYMLYFLEPGLAEAELDPDPRTFLRRLFYSNSGDLSDGRVSSMRLAANGCLTDALEEPPAPLSWFNEDELNFYAATYERTGFRGALNTYRSLERTWQLMAAWADKTVIVPAFYIGASRDVVMHFPGMKAMVERMTEFLPNAIPPIILDGAGHFIQLERAAEVNRLLIDFLVTHFPASGGVYEQCQSFK